MSSPVLEILEGEGFPLPKRRTRVFYNPVTHRIMATDTYVESDGKLYAYDNASDVTDDIAHILATENLTLERGN